MNLKQGACCIDYYVGGVWADESDCFWWFRQIQRSHMGRVVLQCSTMAQKRVEYVKWVVTEEPRNGDAVWMTQCGEPHHIGVWVNGGVLHAVEGYGVIYDTMTQLGLQGWIIERIETYA